MTEMLLRTLLLIGLASLASGMNGHVIGKRTRVRAKKYDPPRIGWISSIWSGFYPDCFNGRLRRFFHNGDILRKKSKCKDEMSIIPKPEYYTVESFNQWLAMCAVEDTNYLAAKGDYGDYELTGNTSPDQAKLTERGSTLRSLSSSSRSSSFLGDGRDPTKKEQKLDAPLPTKFGYLYSTIQPTCTEDEIKFFMIHGCQEQNEEDELCKKQMTEMRRLLWDIHGQDTVDATMKRWGISGTIRNKVAPSVPRPRTSPIDEKSDSEQSEDRGELYMGRKVEFPDLGGARPSGHNIPLRAKEDLLLNKNI